MPWNTAFQACSLYHTPSPQNANPHTQLREKKAGHIRARPSMFPHTLPEPTTYLISGSEIGLLSPPKHDWQENLVKVGGTPTEYATTRHISDPDLTLQVDIQTAGVTAR